MDRRIFLKALGVLSGSTLTAVAGKAAPIGLGSSVGVLVDTTRCMGCRTCELSCAATHDLPKPDLSNKAIFERERTTTESQWTVVNRYTTKAGKISVKKQCMHCSQPACTAACLTKAMYKTKEGPVIWRENKCMGCRYCMVSCPFDIPRFEYGKAVPRIQKCILCWDRLQQGKQPACVEKCPAKALLFGQRSELIETARKRIYSTPGKYFQQIYGEHEAGGTGWLYLSAVPFEQIGFRTDLGKTPYPEYTRTFLYSVPLVLVLGPAMLLALHKGTDSE